MSMQSPLAATAAPPAPPALPTPPPPPAPPAPVVPTRPGPIPPLAVEAAAWEAPEFPAPSFTACQVRTMTLTDEDGVVGEHKLLISSSGNIYRLVRTIRKAIYGSVKDSVQAEVSNGTIRWCRDESGEMIRFAIKAMPWETINRLRGKCAEDAFQEVGASGHLARGGGHPNVATPIESLDDGQKVYLVTPFKLGGEMFDLITEGRLPEPQGKAMARQIISGTVYLHQMMLCHHDLSLENTIMDKEKVTPSIIDLGMSVLMPQGIDHTGSMWRYLLQADNRGGKASYICPEVYKQLDYDGVACDAFALGSMLFLMLVGAPPWNVASRADPRFKMLVWDRNVHELLERWGRPLSAEAVDLIQGLWTYDKYLRLTPERALQHPWLQPH
ncbi:unnamed protein product [Chrysoparadoxa australica]